MGEGLVDGELVGIGDVPQDLLGRIYAGTESKHCFTSTSLARWFRSSPTASPTLISPVQREETVCKRSMVGRFVSMESVSKSRVLPSSWNCNRITAWNEVDAKRVRAGLTGATTVSSQRHRRKSAAVVLSARALPAAW